MASNANLTIESIVAKAVSVDPMMEGYHAEFLVLGGEKPVYVHASATSEFPEYVDFSVSEQPLLPLLDSDNAGETEDAYADARDASTYYGDLDEAADSPYLPIFEIAAQLIEDMQEEY